MIRIITSLVAVLSVASIQSQTTLAEVPKLVIGITIDQLRGDYLQLFQHTFSEKGFKRLLNEGLVYQNMEFGYPNLDKASATATIYTGTTPFFHGIVSNNKFLVDKNSEVSILYDDTYLGNYTKEKLSPASIRVSSITDELKLASQGFSDVYSFAPDPSQAIISAGHAANCAFWMEDYSGKWATTTYYKDFHWIIDQENRTNSYSNRISEMSWTPLISINNYKAFPYTINKAPFQHIFGGNTNTYKLLKTTPIANENIRIASLKLLEKAEMGKRSNPDFLALSFYLGNYTQSVDKNYSLEIQDAYTRLDRDLAIILDQIDKTIGLKNSLIFITSTGYYESEEKYPSDIKMNGGIFYSNRCEALLNMYLMAIYGKEQWVERYYNGQIYLNRKLIEQKNLNLKEIQDKAAEFTIQFSGVQDVATYYQLLNGISNDNMKLYKNIFNKEVSGDIFVELQPGFKIVNEQESSQSDKRIRENAIAAPAIFFGYNIKPEKIKRTIKATEIAPTISHILRIRSPNAAREKVLPEFF